MAEEIPMIRNMPNVSLLVEAAARVMDRRQPSKQEVLDWILSGASEREPSEEERAIYARDLWAEIDEEYARLQERGN
jgi:hypothetical protein